ncbi:MAG: CDP-glucose 4,6-dehydratase [Planctomycetota bacterium]|nr:MAG: CDP-glucose 4,6-dehydratase [Planctomycetota bacterium]
MRANFWRGRRVWITGHTGFKGAWLALLLHHLGAEVHGYALEPPTEPSLFEQAGIASAIEDVRADICDRDALDRALEAARPGIVFHLAAQSLVRASYEDPLETVRTNVLGTACVLEAARHRPEIEAVVVVTSDKCYENREWVWGYRENDPLGGHDPYSASKGCAELVTAAWRRSFCAETRPAIASARAGNVIGGGDWARDRLLPDCIRAFRRAEPVRLRRPEASRPWQHVLDPLAGYLVLAEALCGDAARFAGAWNFGPEEGEVRRVRDVVERAAKLWGDGARWTAEPEATGPHEAHALQLSCARARALLGWKPRLGFEEALAWTIDWYRRHARGESARRLTLEQIERFVARSPREP